MNENILMTSANCIFNLFTQDKFCVFFTYLANFLSIFKYPFNILM